MPTLFETGGVYPHKRDISRLEKYEYFKYLFKGDHHTAFLWMRYIDYIRDEFGLRTPRYKRDDYLVYNMMALVAKVSADLLFGEDVQIKTENEADQEWLEEWMEENNVWQQLYQAGLTAAYEGDVAYRVDRIDDVGVLSFTQPCYFFPGFNTDNMHGKLGYAVMAWMKEDYEGGKWLRTEEHTPELIINRLFKLDGGIEQMPMDYQANMYMPQYRIGREIPIMEMYPDILPEIQTGIDEINIGMIPNFRDLSSYYGVSDIAGVDSLQAEINNRLTANRVILNRHSDPKLGVPKGFMDRRGVARHLETYEFDEAGQKPEYLTWDGKLDNSFAQIQEIVIDILNATETAPALLGMDKGGVESGRALRYKMLRTMAKIRRKQQFFDQGIRDIIRIARKIEGLQPIDIDISWPDGLPTDGIDLANEVLLAANAGAISVEEKVSKLNPEWTEDQVQAEVQRINIETSAPQVTTGLSELLPPPLPTDEEPTISKEV
jgi:hypothetical protein